jgi:uncharacterized protein (TIGR02594 family)
MAGIVGGTASALGGGKFANGAYTGAFQHYLNAEAGEQIQRAIKLNQSHDFLSVADGEHGVREVDEKTGGANSVRKYQKTAGVAQNPTGIAWCGCFVNWVVETTGNSGAIKPAWAQDWINWGKDPGRPVLGAITVFRHANGTGHVGFLDGFTPSGKLVILGGNQRNSVNYTSYELGPNMKLLGYRVPSSQTIFHEPHLRPEDWAAQQGSTR